MPDTGAPAPSQVLAQITTELAQITTVLAQITTELA
jgi:hypothetical protein